MLSCGKGNLLLCLSLLLINPPTQLPSIWLNWIPLVSRSSPVVHIQVWKAVFELPFKAFRVFCVKQFYWSQRVYYTWWTAATKKVPVVFWKINEGTQKCITWQISAYWSAVFLIRRGLHWSRLISSPWTELVSTAQIIPASLYFKSFSDRTANTLLD